MRLPAVVLVAVVVACAREGVPAARADGGAAAVGLAIPTTHPRLWFTPERLAKARAWYKAAPFTPSGEIPSHLAFAAVVTGDRGDRARWCAAAIASALAKTKAMRRDGVACDDCRWYGEDIVLAYDWCHDQLQPAQRAELIERTNRWMEHWRTASWGGAHMTQNNYYWGNVRNELAWGIASYHENPAAETFLRDAVVTRYASSFLPTVATYNQGGVFHEGSGYGRYLAHYPIIPFESARLFGRDLYGETPFWKSAVLHLVYQTTPGPTHNANNGSSRYELFPFNDDSFWINGGSAVSRLHVKAPGSYLGDFMQTMADAAPASPVGQWARQWVETVGAAPLLSPWIQAVAGATRPRPFSSLPLDYYAPGIQYAYARTAWDGASAALQLQLGVPRQVGHQHSDVGNWQLWRGGRWLSRETTGYGERLAGFRGQGGVGPMATAVHNGLLVNPDSQGCTPGETCSGNGNAAVLEDMNGPPVVRRLESRPTHFYACADLSPAYRNDQRRGRPHPERDNPAARHVEREFVFLRDLETLVILDRVEANAVGGVPAERIRRTFLAHCEVDWTLEDAQHATCTNGPQALRLTTLVPAVTERTVTREGSEAGQFRLEVTAAGAAQSYFLHVLQARAASGKSLAPAVTESATELVVTLDAAHAVRFRKGMVSEGGAVTIRGATTPLRADVQPMVVGDGGPVWRP